MELRGKEVQVIKGKFKGEKFIIEGLTQEVFGYKWYTGSIGNPSIMEATQRSIDEGLPPMSSDAFYGKIGGLGHILHESELEISQ